MIELVKQIKTVFPESEIIIEVPERSPDTWRFIDEFKTAGLSGVSRVVKNFQKQE